MCPAPTPSLHLERYIGSCLISAGLPHHQHHQPLQQHNNNNNNNNNHFPKKDLHNHNQHLHLHQHHHQHHHQTRFRRYPQQQQQQQQQNSADFCSPVNNNNTGTGNSVLPSNQQTYPRTWTTAAGLPLISMSPASPRRGGAGPPSGIVANNNHHHQHHHQHHQHHHHHNNNNNNNNSNNIIPGIPIKDNKQSDERSPLSRLAIHTQGAPLIQAGRHHHHHHHHQPRLIKQNNNNNKQKKEKDQKDSSSVASDESSGNSENSLPRIIKPRKRRKKDRKPQPTPAVTTGTTATTQQANSNNVAPTNNNSNNNNNNQQLQQQTSTTTILPTDVTSLQETAIVTLKPYTPLCQDFTSQKSGTTITTATVNSPTTPAINNEEEIKRKAMLTINYQQQKDNYQLTQPEDNKPALTTSTSTSSSCQCRYCDPINLTWDVDQRCYSPYLTAPTMANYNTPLLTTSSSTPSSTVSSISPTLSTSSSQDCWSPDSRGSSLEVSSEIITSPNGHRDIEIKFFSSSLLNSSKNTTLQQTAITRPISVTPPWPN